MLHVKMYVIQGSEKCAGIFLASPQKQAVAVPTKYFCGEKNYMEWTLPYLELCSIEFNLLLLEEPVSRKDALSHTSRFLRPIFFLPKSTDNLVISPRKRMLWVLIT